jgi:PGF-pre-PGF domain-containing protein
MGVSKFVVLALLFVLIFSVANADVRGYKVDNKTALLHISKGNSVAFGTMSTGSNDIYEPDNSYSFSTYYNGTPQEHNLDGNDVDWIYINCSNFGSRINISVNSSKDVVINTYNSYMQLLSSNVYLVWDNSYRDYAGFLKGNNVVQYCSPNQIIYVEIYAAEQNISFSYELTVTAVSGGDNDNSINTVNDITVNSSINGTFSFFSNDEDFYKFNATKDNVYIIETANRTPLTDTFLTLYNSSGKILDYNDDSNAYYTSRIVWRCNSTGTYYISVYNNLVGNGTDYSLSVRELNASDITDIDLNNVTNHSFPSGKSIMFFSFNVTNNTYVINATNLTSSLDTYIVLYDENFTFLRQGDDHFVNLQRNINPIITTYLPSGKYYIAVSDWGLTVGSFNVSVTNLPANGDYDIYEPDNNFENATFINDTRFNQTNHTFYYLGESDFVKVNLTEGRTYIFYAENTSSRLVDTYIRIYDSAGNLVAYNDDIGDGCTEKNVSQGIFGDCLSKVVFTPKFSGVYYVEVYDISSVGDDYSLTIYEVGSLSLSILGFNSTGNVTRNGEFEFTTKVSCTSGYCGNIALFLDPQKNVKSILESAKITPSDEDFSVSPDGRYIVLLKDNPTIKNSNIRASAVRRNVKDKFISSAPGIKILHKYNLFNMVAVELTPAQLNSLKDNPYVLDIVPDKKVKVDLNESVKQIWANHVWTETYNNTYLNGSGQVVCLLDTGVNYSHPALNGHILKGPDFVNHDNDPMDDYGHGTHVAGIIVSNDANYTGVAPGAMVYAVKVLDNNGNGYISNILKGIDWCINHSKAYNSSNPYDISVISMSLGTISDHWDNETKCAQDNKEWLDVINKALDYDISLVAASGNENNKTAISAPACLPGVISVGAVDKDDTIASYSNIAPILDLLAPGVDIRSTCMDGGFCVMNGTSMAAPHVAGALLIMNELERLRTNHLVPPSTALSVLNSTGKKIFDNDTNRNYTLINVSAAIDKLRTSSQKGLVPVNDGYPFYITTHVNYPGVLANPLYPDNKSCLQNMKAGDSCNVTWIVKVNSIENGPWSFFVKAENEYGLSNVSNTVNISIVDNYTIPSLEINTPQNNTNIGENARINVSSFCNTSLVNYVNYILSNGSWSYSDNLTRVSFGVWVGTVHTLNLSAGDYTLNITAYNYFGNSTSKVVNIFVDSQPPAIYPSMIFNGNLTPGLNYTVDDNYKIDSVWYKVSSGDFNGNYAVDNKTFSNYTFIHLNYPGYNNITIWANDTSNNTIEYLKSFTEVAESNLTQWAISHNATLIPNGTNIFNNQSFNISFRVNNSTLYLSGVNGTAVWWDYNFTLQENNTPTLTNLFLANGLTPLYTLYLDENFIRNETCVVEYISGSYVHGSKSCTQLDGDYTSLINTTFDFSSRFDVYSCGRGIPRNISSCTELPVCNSTVVNNCYFNNSGKLSAKIDNFSTLVLVNDTTPPEIDITSPKERVYYNGSEIFDMMLNVSVSPDTLGCNYTLSNNSHKMNKSNDFFVSKIGPLKNGAYNITISCVDGAGNVNSANIYFRINDLTNPLINSSTITNSSTSSSVTIHWKTDEPTRGEVILYEDNKCSSVSSDETDDTYSISHTVTITHLHSSKTYYYVIKSFDYQGNPSSLGCFPVTTKEAVLINEPGEKGAGGGSGGGGGNGTSRKVSSEVFLWNDISGKVSAKIHMKGIPLDKLDIYLAGNTSNARLEVKSFGDQPPGNIPRAPGNVYQYFDISPSFEQMINYMKLNLKVPSVWFERNKYDPEKVKLYHFVGNKWVEENIKPTGKVGEYYTYESIVNSFSPFAISAEKLKLNYCGDGICNQTAGESCSNCEKDCGICLPQILRGRASENSTQTIGNSTASGAPSSNSNIFLYIAVALVASSLVIAYRLVRERLW